MTQEGFDKLQKKLDQLKNVERPKTERRLGEAREMGDLSENAEFDAAREELWRIDGEISKLEDETARAEVISADKVAKDEVAFGATVMVKDANSGDEFEYTFVGEGESDPFNGKVAITTPIGQALLGHRKGDTVKVNIPAGTRNYKIVKIKY